MPKNLTNSHFSVVNTARQRIRNPQEMIQLKPRFEVAMLLHFQFRTVQEHVAKRERGRGTLDCDTERSVGNKRCAKVHGARDTPNKISFTDKEYTQYSTSAVETISCKHSQQNEQLIQKNMCTPMIHLSAQTKRVLCRRRGSLAIT